MDLIRIKILLSGVAWGGWWEWEEGSVWLKLIHIVVQHKPIQHCKAIILQLKKKKYYRQYLIPFLYNCIHLLMIYHQFQCCLSCIGCNYLALTLYLTKAISAVLKLGINSLFESNSIWAVRRRPTLQKLLHMIQQSINSSQILHLDNCVRITKRKQVISAKQRNTDYIFQFL